MRTKISAVTLPESLDILIPRYAQNKQELDDYKKICDKENRQIKDSMKALGETEHPAGDYIAKYSVQQRESMNEDILISLFTSVPAFVGLDDKYNIVKTKPYIDFDALEKALYNNELSETLLADLDKAREVKEVVTLRVSKIKKKKEDK